MTRTAPSFRDLSASESRSLLRRHRVGRIAFTFRDRVDIEPISYVASGPWLYARTSPGTKLTQLRHNPWVAFEVDEVKGPLAWQSVVAHGTAYFLEPGDAAYQRAVGILRRVDPGALGNQDLTPRRRVVFRIHLDKISGRRASTSRR